MGLRGENQVPLSSLRPKHAGFPQVIRQELLHVEPVDSAAVVRELDDVVLVGRTLLRVHDHVEQGIWLELAVDDQVSPEKPVARVFAVGLGEVEAFHDAGVAAE